MSYTALYRKFRPAEFGDVKGQDHIITTLQNQIKANRIGHAYLFCGTRGTGKTTLAKVIAHTTSAEFLQINATSAGKKDMEEVIAQAKNNQGMYGRKTILFIDEIHRFNKGQQDYLLPFVEDGTIILIGATTENPYFEVNGAFLSRSIIFELKSLSKEDIRTLILRAVNDREKGLGAYDAVIDAVGLDVVVNSVLPLVKMGGDVCVYGVMTKNPTFDLSKAPYNFDLHMHQWPTRSEEKAAMTTLAQWIEEGTLSASDFITHRFKIEEIEEAFAAVKRGEVLKCVLTF